MNGLEQAHIEQAIRVTAVEIARAVIDNRREGDLSTTASEYAQCHAERYIRAVRQAAKDAARQQSTLPGIEP